MAHTVFEDRENVFSATKAGASGYILKGSSPREIVEAIHNLYNGGSPMSPKIARKVINEFQDETISEQYILSHREKEVLRCIEEGLTYKEISENQHKPSYSAYPYKEHLRKLQTKGRSEALTKARKKVLSDSCYMLYAYPENTRIWRDLLQCLPCLNI